MAVDLSYTEGVIAARDKYLLKDRVFRLCEMTAEDAFRSLLEYGFGGGAETASSVYDYEKLIVHEENALDAFILEFTPSKAEAAYLLSPRDFHNAKALLKARLLSAEAEKMLCSRGLVSIEDLSACVQTAQYDFLVEFPRLKEACEEVERAFLEERPLSGKDIGLIFERATYRHLMQTCKKSGVLRRSIEAKIDMTNLLTAFRLRGEESLSDFMIEGGKLSLQEVADVLSDGWKEGAAYHRYGEFVRLCRLAKERGMPFTAAEKYRDSYDVVKLDKNRYELKRNEPFLYYVLRRKAENANVRIIFALHLLGATEQEIKSRLRGV